MRRWNIQKRTTVFARKILSVDDLLCVHPKGIEHTFTIINTSDWINIVPVTKDGKIIFVRQHRLGTDEISIETPAGMLDQGESPLEAAHRELQEETGYTARQIIPMKSLKANPAIMNNTIHFFLALDCERTNEQNLDREEDIEVSVIDRAEVIDMIRDGRIDHSIIVTALSLYLSSSYSNSSFSII
ncbi:MAG TPA: NUDIX hydrolase [Spirochaetota bacterium]